jgi:hypothetical protein
MKGKKMGEKNEKGKPVFCWQCVNFCITGERVYVPMDDSPEVLLLARCNSARGPIAELYRAMVTPDLCAIDCNEFEFDAVKSYPAMIASVGGAKMATGQGGKIA